MLSVISWHCACGLHVKAMYETDGTTRVRCPDPKGKCQITHPVDGKGEPYMGRDYRSSLDSAKCHTFDCIATVKER